MQGYTKVGFKGVYITQTHFHDVFQIQLVCPIGPELLRLLPPSIKVPSSSVIAKDEVHLIMEVIVNNRHLHTCDTFLGPNREIGHFW